jgi:hypothetical protein
VNSTALPHAELEPSPKRPLVPVPRIAAENGLEARSLYRAIRLGVVPLGVVVHVGRRVLICCEAWERWVAAGGSALPGRGDPAGQAADGHPMTPKLGRLA